MPPALYERFKQRFGVDVLDGIGSTEALHMFISNKPGAIRPGSSGQIVDIVLEFWGIFVVTSVAGSFASFFTSGYQT